MSRSDQVGLNAPRKGSLLRTSQSGVAAFQVPASERFPPPDFLSETQINIWNAALDDIPLEFFRARHIPMMIQYVRAVEKLMVFSDEFEADGDDTTAMNRWDRMIRIVSRLEKHLGLDTHTLHDRVMRARAEFRAAHQGKNAHESTVNERGVRTGLVYVGH